MKTTCAKCERDLGVAAGMPEGALAFCDADCAFSWASAEWGRRNPPVPEPMSGEAPAEAGQSSPEIRPEWELSRDIAKDLAKVSEAAGRVEREMAKDLSAGGASVPALSPEDRQLLGKVVALVRRLDEERVAKDVLRAQRAYGPSVLTGAYAVWRREGFAGLRRLLRERTNWPAFQEDEDLGCAESVLAETRGPDGFRTPVQSPLPERPFGGSDVKIDLSCPLRLPEPAGPIRAPEKGCCPPVTGLKITISP